MNDCFSPEVLRRMSEEEISAYAETLEYYVSSHVDHCNPAGLLCVQAMARLMLLTQECIRRKLDQMVK